MPDFTILILIVILGTQLTRFVPFFWDLSRFSVLKSWSVQSLLPMALMVYLVVYSYSDFGFNPHYYMKLIAGVLVFCTHVTLRNFVVSILSGTLSYCLMVNLYG